MSNQMEDGWYPECDDCGCGNLGKSITLCEDCLKELLEKEDIKTELKKFL